MLKIFVFFVAIILSVNATDAATTRAAAAMRNTNAQRNAGVATNTTEYNYNYMYPYMNNQMRTAMNPGTTQSQNNPINTMVRTSTNDTRRVIPRSAARVATVSSQRTNQPVTNRRVVPRAAQRVQNSPNANVVRAAVQQRTPANTVRSVNQNTAGNVSSARCMSDYTECMNNYCMREKTAYNRCYCSAKLAQIDATYKNDIDKLIMQIAALKNGNNSINTDEINQYWMDTIGKYYGENSWENIDNALDGIDWSTFESRVRGQQAFATGHEYCSQHLRGCFYMANNLRDAYRSQISRDCAVYENNLQKIKAAAETLLSTYQE